MRAADHLYEKEDWAQAHSAFEDALRLYLLGFQPAAEALRSRRDNCENQLQTTQQAA